MTDRWTPQEKLLLAVICGVVFLDTLDLSLVQVALPSIGSALHLGEAPLQWIVSAFVLGYGGFLLLGGRCADVLGRRRVLLAGLIALAAASPAAPAWAISSRVRSPRSGSSRRSIRPVAPALDSSSMSRCTMPS